MKVNFHALSNIKFVICKFFQFARGWKWLKPLLDGKILDWSKLKASAENSVNVAKMAKCVIDKIENIVVIGENAGF